VERKLGGFREGAGYDQQQDGQIERMPGQGRGLAQGKLKGSRSLTDQEEAGQQGEPPRSGDEKRLEGGGSSARPLVFEADEEVRAQARQFPECEYEKEIPGQDEAKHGAHEREKESEEASEPRMTFEGRSRIDDDQSADAGNEQRECQAQAIEIERQPEAEARHPVELLREGFAPDDAGQKAQKIAEEKDRKKREQALHPRSAAPAEQRSGEGKEKTGTESEQHASNSPFTGLLVGFWPADP
jgi:hypothetical protein